MENNNNGRGIFYGVIGVATLVVAIIGATFAYFTASVRQNYAINGVSSGTVDLTFTKVAENFKSDLIPVETDDEDEFVDIDHDGNPGTEAVSMSPFAKFPGFTTNTNGEGTCTDLVGNDICSVYSFTISNPSTSTQTIQGSMTVNVNGKTVDGTKVEFTNLKYALFKGDGSKSVADGGFTVYNVNGTPSAVTHAAAAGTLIAKGTIPSTDNPVVDSDTWATNTKIQLDATGGTNSSITYTILLWLEDTGAAQDAEQGLPFAASLTFASEAGSGVTGVITT